MANYKSCLSSLQNGKCENYVIGKDIPGIHRKIHALCASQYTLRIHHQDKKIILYTSSHSLVFQKATLALYVLSMMN